MHGSAAHGAPAVRANLDKGLLGCPRGAKHETRALIVARGGDRRTFAGTQVRAQPLERVTRRRCIRHAQNIDADAPAHARGCGDDDPAAMVGYAEVAGGAHGAAVVPYKRAATRCSSEMKRRR